ncbi:MAG: BamA/TamA family outer membrane protein [Deltaproteobacteria bacterium]|nr:BamA/TamA family outer membrane protein [Deltaproteobacteria bacterium]
MAELTSVVVEGVHYLPLSVQKVQFKPDEKPEQVVDRVKVEIGHNLQDELIFHNPEDKFVYVAQLTRLPDAALKTPLDPETVRLSIDPAARVVFREDEPEAYVLSRVEVVGIADPAVKQQVEKVLDLEAGDKVSFADLLEKREKLLKECPLLAVQPQPAADPADPTKLVLTVRAIDHPRGVEVLDLDGSDPAKAIIERMFDGTRLDRAALERIQQQIHQYFQHAQFLYQVTKSELSTEGKLRIAVLKIPAPTAIELQGVEGDETEAALRALFPTPLTAPHMEAGLKAVEAYYYRHGQMPKLTMGVRRKQDGNVLVVTVSTEVAPKRVVFRGNYPFAHEALEAAFGAPDPVLHVYTAEQISAGIERVRNFCTEHGYRIGQSAQFRIHDGVVELALNLARLKGYRIVMVEKARNVDDRLVTRELAQRPGELFNEIELRKGIARLRGSGNFSAVNYVVDQAGGEDDVYVDIVCRPGPAIGEVMLSGGYSGALGWTVMAGTQLRHIPAEGETLGLSGHYAPNSYGGVLNWYEPWAFSNKISLSASLYFNVDDLVIANQRVGVGMAVGIPLGGKYSPWRIILGTDVEYLHVEDGETIEGLDRDTPVLVKPSLKLVYGEGPLTAYVQGRINAGAMTYQEARGGIQYDVDLGKGFVLRIAGGAGQQFGTVPDFTKFNQLNTPSVYGRSLSDYEIGVDFAVASLNIHKTLLDTDYAKIGLHGGVTIGGVGARKTDFGFGAGVDLLLMGMPFTVELGGRYDLAGSEGFRWGVSLLTSRTSL